MSLIDVKPWLKKVREWVSPDPPGDEPVPIVAARALLERDRFSSLLSYRDTDDRHFVHLEDSAQPAIGFVLGINPLVVAGTDAEPQLEAVLNACPSETIVQFGAISTPQVEHFINTWTRSRLEKAKNPLLKQVAMRRRDFMLATAEGPSLLPTSRMHPRMLQWYVAVRLPFKGDRTNKAELDGFLKQGEDLRNTISGALNSIGIHSEALNENAIRFLLRELLNPQIPPADRIDTAAPEVPMHRDLVDRRSRITVSAQGTLDFAIDGKTPEVSVACLTVDAAPKTLSLPMMSQVLGSPESPDDRITCPYWAYTNIHVMDPDVASDNLTVKLGMLNRQTMSESAWYRSMMAHLFERRDATHELKKETEKGHRLVRAYAGINLYCHPDEVRAQTEYVKGLWRRTGFRISEEKYISLPAFVASLPLQYTPTMDPPNKGLQRAWLMSSLNAASMVMLQGDWQGTGPQFGGPLLVSRKGALASFDLLKTQSNYNFVVIAASGSGKSFLANEIVGDFLSKNGMARLIDVGRSYHRFCSMMDGQNVVFSPDKPVSLNPFSGIHHQEDLNELMPMLKDLLRLMAYPLTPEDQTPAFQYQLLEKAIQEAWTKKREAAELSDIHAWLKAYNDPQNRSQDLAVQLEPFAIGRYRQWFTGPRTVSFDNPFVVVELEELKQDAALQSVVLQLMIYQITQEMYLSDRAIPKLLAVDEAWDLLGGMKTGRFIETAFRRARKYNAIAGVITQSYQDFEKSPAARAALENAAWQFVLYQRPESLEFAMKTDKIIGGQATLDLMRSVRSGKGYSEVFVRGESGSGLYRFCVDRHSYYTFTTNPVDINKIDALTRKGIPLVEAIDQLAKEDYAKMWRGEFNGKIAG
ncbi:MAG: TraC family protein [Terriglobia bacterium]|nr:TraC family protein [Terriglobia bacterium]